MAWHRNVLLYSSSAWRAEEACNTIDPPPPPFLRCSIFESSVVGVIWYQSSMKVQDHSSDNYSTICKLQGTLCTGLIFPPEIASTTQRPDIAIYSKSKKIVVLIELTCPLEDRISTAHELKKDRYLELLSNCRCNGWTAFHFPVEVGSRGFVAYSLTSCLQKLGFSSYLAKKARNKCSKIALRASYSIYLQQNIREWSGR